MTSPTQSLPIDFQSIPLCAEVLNRAGMHIEKRKHLNKFFNTTLRNNDAVHSSIFCYQLPEDSQASIVESYLLVHLGSGITGQPNIAHGGFLATVMDEVTGNLINVSNLDNGSGILTASLNISYQKPVRAPGVIMAAAKVVKLEGRKIYFEAAIKDMTGDTCATSEVLFIANRPGKC